MNFLSAIFWDTDPIFFSILGYEMHYYTLCFMLGFIISYVVMLRVFKRENISQDLLDQLSIYIFVGTLLGARIGHCLFYEFDYYKDHLLEMILPIRFEDGQIKLTGFHGLASHGGGIGIFTGLYLFCRKTKMDFIWLADRLVIVVAAAGAMVRIGNFFNSEIIGLPSDLPWAVIFAKVDAIPRHPAQLYEAIAYICIFIFLWIYYKRSASLKRGWMLGIFLILLFTVRILVEFIKENQEAFEDSMTFNMGQWLSVPFVLAGLYLVLRKDKKIDQIPLNKAKTAKR